MRAQHAIDVILENIDYDNIETRLIEGADTVDAVIEHSEGFDLIVVPASDEPLFKNLLVGTRSERIARRAKVTVMMVKRRSSPLHSFVRQALLEPTSIKPLDDV